MPNVLPKYLGIKELFFLRLYGKSGTDEYHMMKESHFSTTNQYFCLSIGKPIHGMGNDSANITVGVWLVLEVHEQFRFLNETNLNGEANTIRLPIEHLVITPRNLLTTFHIHPQQFHLII